MLNQEAEGYVVRYIIDKLNSEGKVLVVSKESKLANNFGVHLLENLNSRPHALLGEETVLVNEHIQFVLSRQENMLPVLCTSVVAWSCWTMERLAKQGWGVSALTPNAYVRRVLLETWSSSNECGILTMQSKTVDEALRTILEDATVNGETRVDVVKLCSLVVEVDENGRVSGMYRVHVCEDGFEMVKIGSEY